MVSTGPTYYDKLQNYFQQFNFESWPHNKMLYDIVDMRVAAGGSIVCVATRPVGVKTLTRAKREKTFLRNGAIEAM